MPDEVHKLTNMGRLPAGPYQGTSPEELSRLSSDVSYSDKRSIYTFCAVPGIHNRIAQIFYHRVAEDCRQFLKQKPNATLDEREQFLLLSINRRSAPELVTGQSISNESGSTPSEHSQATGSGNVKASNPPKSGIRGGRKTQEASQVGKEVQRGGRTGDVTG